MNLGEIPPSSINILLLVIIKLYSDIFYFLNHLFIFIYMNDTEKARRYNQLTYFFDKLSNQISSIKGESIDLNPQQLTKIRQIQEQQQRLMAELQRLM